MDERTGDVDAERAAEQRRPAEFSPAAADLSRRVSAPSSGPHLLRRPCGDSRDRAAAYTARARRIRSSASCGGREGRLTLFFVFFFFGRSQARGSAERFAVVEQRQIAHVQ